MLEALDGDWNGVDGGFNEGEWAYGLESEFGSFVAVIFHSARNSNFLFEYEVDHEGWDKLYDEIALITAFGKGSFDIERVPSPVDHSNLIFNS
jgi:hypothetical protein